MSTTDDPQDAPTALRPAHSVPSRHEPRFTPGMMLGDRYRIVALLGSGGMGEVFRAEDTKLGQQVALKFLPHDMRADPSRVERLYSEVRLGRQVSHPNVCRLYDIGEWEGNHFLAMEYVDGEDLSSLLRRIGKLPPAKAFDIAREICAGIAAAHGLGIIHRDLKPANIMIDGRGQARITDFGLAVVAEELAGRSEIAGTPAYMAPEQLTGGPVTQKADLYALGLILFEIFTGRRLFDGVSSADAGSRRSALRTLTSSGDSREMDPAIQRVIARCVEENPDARPASIHAVIAALPGGDPLQAALDAGETPSPQMVAAAGEVGDLKASVAWSILVVALLAFGAVLMLFGKSVLIRLVPLPKPPEALVERARTILADAGYTARARDSSYYIQTDDDYLRAAIKKDATPTRWQSLHRLRPGVLFFGYRESPKLLVAANDQARVTETDPPMTEPGMTHVIVDMQGRLLSFKAVPPERGEGAPAGEVNWAKFFAYAGGDIENLKPVPATWTASVDADEKKSWQGHYRDAPDTPIRVEAGSVGGRPVWFRIVGPWVQPRGSAPQRGAAVPEVVFQLVTAGSLILAAFLARRNLRRSRGDRRTAFRLAAVMFIVATAGHLLRADHVSAVNIERGLIERGVAWALFQAAVVWVLYLALEPFVRRRWPHTLIGWTRLFSGRLRDPMIGRDLLIGTCTGFLLQVFLLGGIYAPAWFGAAPLLPAARWVTPMLGLRHLLFAWSFSFSIAVTLALSVVLLLLIALMLFRKRWLAVGAVWLFLTLVSVYGESPLLEFGIWGAASALLMFVMLRFGVLASTVALFVMGAVEAAPLTLDVDAWYFDRAAFSMVFFLALVGYGFWASLGEKSAFAVPLLDEG